MRSVQVNVEAKTVTFGGGCRWSDVDDECWKHGLATVGGTVNDTGVGGLTLGGGYGWLSSKYGLVCDNLLAAEVVLADGRVVQVSEKDNSDLFWGIRGAGQSFGVATSFTLQAYEQKHVYTGFVLFPLSALSTIVDFVNSMHDLQDPNSSFMFGPSCIPPNNDPALVSVVFYDGTEDEGKKFFKPLLDIALANLAECKPYPEANVQLGDVSSRPPRKLQGGATFVPPLKMEHIQDVIDKFFPFVKQNGLETGSIVAWEILPNNKIREVGLQDTAFAARDNIYHVSPLWQCKQLSDFFATLR
jgi:FAD/FMN-containing dehydrogenase